jgi:hypothetical protein
VAIRFVPAMDGLPPEDGDLLLTRIVNVTDRDNAYFELIEANKVLDLTNQELQKVVDSLDGKSWDDNFVQSVLAKNDQVLNTFDQVVQKSNYQNPQLANPGQLSPEVDLSPNGNFRKVADLAALKSLYLLKQGRSIEAFDNNLKVIGLGQKIENSQGMIIDYLIGLSIKTTGLKVSRMIIKKADLSSQDLRRYTDQLDSLKENGENLKRAYKMEYMHTVATTEFLLMGKKTNFLYEPNNTKEFFASLARAEVASVDNKPYGVEVEPAKYNFSHWHSPITTNFTRNAVGKIEFSISGVVLNTPVIRKNQVDLLVGVNQLMLALKSYKLDNAVYPETLNQLVPNYISSLPRDPFSESGQLLGYSKDKEEIYSSGHDHGLQEDDLVFNFQ